ncbi:hypothetical protein [Pseudochrobactrum asaccharolyticum]|uniref:hypothetical protein n=1 Tax=Pseudochrobactrum asaccharolyticum TaxID=354351 RepID=UPI0040438F34
MKNIFTLPFKAALSAVIAVEKMIIGMLNAVLRLFGAKPLSTSTRRLPGDYEAPEKILSEVRNNGFEYAVPTSDKLLKPTSEAGHTLYRYACARTCEERSTVDLSALSTEQQTWLLMLSDADLEQLAKVGVDGCTKAAAGKRCGVFGLPDMPEPPSELEKMSKLEKRIRLYKSVGYAT